VNILLKKSTGGNRVKNPSAPLAGLANISIGKYKSQQHKEGEDSFDMKKFSKSDFNKPLKNEPKETIYKFEPIRCNKTVLKDDDLSIILEFSGINFSQSNFKFLETTNTFFTTVDYKDKGSYLTLTITEDIFEFSIFYKEFGTDREYRDELYIPELLTLYKDKVINMRIDGNKIIIEYK
jgi:hypothetical protein